mmetsp:Transcript_8783/g.17472  ORF Transcript_8783/g.17472 Transcript_8783/m.17472 type:complete len:204 (+) Transcript_8783:671-1282(+)
MTKVFNSWISESFSVGVRMSKSATGQVHWLNTLVDRGITRTWTRIKAYPAVISAAILSIISMAPRCDSANSSSAFCWAWTGTRQGPAPCGLKTTREAFLAMSLCFFCIILSGAESKCLALLQLYLKAGAARSDASNRADWANGGSDLSMPTAASTDTFAMPLGSFVSSSKGFLCCSKGKRGALAACCPERGARLLCCRGMCGS